jgi:bifunctional non-homologous end joining protein LigD
MVHAAGQNRRTLFRFDSFAGANSSDRMQYRPQLAAPSPSPPEGDEWLHEIEYDGARIGCRIDRGRVQLVAPDGADWTERLPRVAAAAADLPVRRSALIDGEAAVVVGGGATSRTALDRALRAGRSDRIMYFLFDLLELDGRDLRRRPLEQRKAALHRLVADCNDPLCYAEHVVGRGARFFAAACRRGLIGIVSKQRGGRYTEGRCPGWLKTPCQPSRGDRPGREAEVLGVRISHPERVMFPRLGLTKLDLARYAAEVADSWVPHVAGRPLTLVRCERGVGDGGEGCVYMRHRRAWGPPALRHVSIREKTKTGEYLIADTPAALVALIQMDVVEVHTWNVRAGDVERPDRIVFDLDPGDEISWAEVVEAGRIVRAGLEALELASWVKNTGGRGLHVVVPIRPERDWSECLQFARGFAEHAARQRPDLFTVRFARAGRGRLILLDYLRNNRTNTSVAALSPRARPGAPVSMPLAWRELSVTQPGDRHGVTTAPRRLARLARDPWTGYFASRQRLGGAALRSVVRR